jgi:hypothetical protein
MPGARRVAPEDRSPGAPTDPYVPNSGIRLLRSRFRCAKIDRMDNSWLRRSPRMTPVRSATVTLSRNSAKRSDRREEEGVWGGAAGRAVLGWIKLSTPRGWDASRGRSEPGVCRRLEMRGRRKLRLVSGISVAGTRAGSGVRGRQRRAGWRRGRVGRCGRSRSSCSSEAGGDG